MSNKKLFSIISAVLIGVTFVLGHYISKNIHSNTKNKYDNISVRVNSGELQNKDVLNKVVNKDAQIVFKSDTNKNRKYVTEIIKKVSDEGIVGKKGIDVEQRYKNKGYILNNITDNTIEFIRKPIKYQPNMYVLLVENNEIIIAKSDENGCIFDKNGDINNRQGTGTKINSLREQDKLNILMGDKTIQFNSIESLNDGIRNFDIKYEMPE